MTPTYYIDKQQHQYRPFFNKDSFVEWTHEWVQICGELFPDSKNGKMRDAEQAAYELYKQKQYETKFVSKYWRKKQ